MHLEPLHGGADPVAGAGTGAAIGFTFLALLVVLGLLGLGLWAYVRRRFATSSSMLSRREGNL